MPDEPSTDEAPTEQRLTFAERMARLDALTQSLEEIATLANQVADRVGT